MGEENTNLTVFENGMRLVTRHIPNYPVKANIRIGTGSRDEIFGDHKRGTAHYLEHMLFKGSEGFAEPSQVSRVIASVGGKLKAATDFDAIILELEVPKDKVALGVHVVGSMLSSPILPASAMPMETRRIQNEWLLGDMDPDKMRFLNTVRVSGGNTPLLNPVLGDEASIASITRNDLVRFHQEKVVPRNIVLAFEGDLSQCDLPALVKTHFRLPDGIQKLSTPPEYMGGDERLPESTRGTRVMLGFAVPPRIDMEQSPPFVMLSKIMGGSDQDSLFRTMSQDTGLVYAVDVNRRPFADYGLLTVGFTCFPENVQASVELIADRLKGLARYIDPVTFENQRLADISANEAKKKEVTIGADVLADDVAVYGRVLPRDHFYKLQASVTPADVSAAARAVLEKPHTFYASGNLDGVPSPQENSDLLKPLRPQSSAFQGISSYTGDKGAIPEGRFSPGNIGSASL